MNRILTLLVFALAVFSYYLNSRLNEIDRIHQQDRELLQQSLLNLEQTFNAELKHYLKKDSVNQLPFESAATPPGNTALREHVTKLRKGLYVAELNVQIFNEARTRKITKEFTLYHTREMVQNDGKPYPLNLGIAFSGIASVPLFYIDYDNDGNIDLDIMQEFVYFLPGGRLLAKSIDPARAQAVYEAFLLQQENASYYSSERIKDSGSKLSAQLWDFMHEKSKDLAAWIEAHAAATSTDSLLESNP